MRKWLFKYAFGLALKSVNGFLEENRENVDLVKAKLELWISRVRKILDLLERGNRALDDNRLTEEEIESLTKEAKENVRDW